MDRTCLVGLVLGTVFGVCVYLVGSNLTHARWCWWMGKGLVDLAERAKGRPLTEDDVVAVFGAQSSPARSAIPRLKRKEGT
jgi:hypothetical protein